MKALLLLSVFSLLSALSGLSQNCEFEENKVDKFTKRRTLSTKSETIWLEGALLSRANLVFSVGLVDSTKLIIAQMNCNNTRNFDWFESFSSLLLMNEAGDIIKLAPRERCKYNFSGDSEWVSYWQYYFVNDATWTALSSFPITSIRVYMEDSSGIPFYDLEIKDKNKNILSNGVSCVNDVISKGSKK